MDTPYTAEYFAGFLDESRSSAEALVPMVMDLVSPSSVIDVGCGTGAWLSAFRRNGVENIHGIDGPYVRPEQLLIPQAMFTPHELTEPLVWNKTYDLAMSVEVAEHLPEAAAAGFVGFLTSLAPVVLFSAAVPHQPGERHINCQWPTYWANLFKQQGYIHIDAIRPRVWADERVAWWYRQNILIYLRADELNRRPALAGLQAAGSDKPLNLVHPEMFRLFLEWGLDQQQRYCQLYETYEHR